MSTDPVAETQAWSLRSLARNARIVRALIEREITVCKNLVGFVAGALVLLACFGVAKDRGAGATTAFDSLCGNFEPMMLIAAALVGASVFRHEKEARTWRLLASLPVSPLLVVLSKLGFVVAVLVVIAALQVALCQLLASEAPSLGLVLRILLRMFLFAIFAGTTAALMVLLERRLTMILAIIGLAWERDAEWFPDDATAVGPFALVRRSIAGEDLLWPVKDGLITGGIVVVVVATLAWRLGRNLGTADDLAARWSTRAALALAALAVIAPRLPGLPSRDAGLPVGVAAEVGDVVAVNHGHVLSPRLLAVRAALQGAFDLQETKKARVLITERPDITGARLTGRRETLIVELGPDASAGDAFKSLWPTPTAGESVVLVGAHEIYADELGNVPLAVATGESSIVALPRRLTLDDLDHFRRLDSEYGTRASRAMAKDFVFRALAGKAAAPIVRLGINEEEGDDLALLHEVGAADDAIAVAFAGDSTGAPVLPPLDLVLTPIYISQMTRGLIITCSDPDLIEARFDLFVERPLDPATYTNSAAAVVAPGLLQRGHRVPQTWVPGDVLHVIVSGKVRHGSETLGTASRVLRYVLR